MNLVIDVEGMTPPRVQVFMWCAAKGKFLTREELKNRKLLLDGTILACSLWGSQVENFLPYLLGL